MVGKNNVGERNFFRFCIKLFIRSSIVFLCRRIGARISVTGIRLRCGLVPPALPAGLRRHSEPCCDTSQATRQEGATLLFSPPRLQAKRLARLPESLLLWGLR